MRIFNWVQSKLTGKPEKNRHDAGSTSARYSQTSDTRKEEFRDWPEGLLAIGTFGSNKDPSTTDHQDSNKHETSESSSSSRATSDFTLDEVSKLHRALTKLARKSKSSRDGSDNVGSADRANLPLNRFLNCPSSLEVDRTASLRSSEAESNDDNGDFSPNTRIILNKARDILSDNHNAIKKKSLSFLLKKMFVCASGFGPSPSLRDPIPESRMEKLLRTMLKKQMQNQNSARPASMKYLDNRPVEKKLDTRDKSKDKGEDRYQWVKTDSEYIVLEI